jgi:hypothetical protein
MIDHLICFLFPLSQCMAWPIDIRALFATVLWLPEWYERLFVVVVVVYRQLERM